MLTQPFFDIGMIMCAIVVQNQVKVHAPRALSIDLPQEFQKLHIPMSRVTGANYFPSNT